MVKTLVLSCAFVAHDELEAVNAIVGSKVLVLLQVQGPLAEAAARAATRAWRCRDVVSSLGAVQLVCMLDFPGKHTTRVLSL